MESKLVAKFSGHNYLRQRLVMATLAGRALRVDQIRAQADSPGLVDYEISFLRLLEKVTNGSVIEIGYTGTSFLYRPGLLAGGKVFHDCPTSRAVGYFLEAMVALAPFCKKPLNLRLTGITSDNVDMSVDTIRTVSLVQLTSFGIPEDVELKIVKRGSAPQGGGEVHFSCPVVHTLTPVLLVDEGRIKRIRGIVHATRVSPEMPNRVVTAARAYINRYIPDIYLYTDLFKGADSGKSPGYGASLVAETTTGARLCAELCAQPGQTPEEVGALVAKQLLHEIQKGGYFDTNHQWLPLLLMTLCPEDVSKIRLGRLSEFTIQYLRDIREMFNTTFKIKPDPETKTVLLTCIGSGYSNVNKKRT
ncbi:hypothetical protein IWQ60_000694 [Tieghemiomyces parasiticus]|uniref:RNA 3'-terminal phosphate cyclase-like protein n=1 Tax=Tieghemiomyces parasiticus TaxID=78921 RepID=A0A9W8AIC1_9FUNG|nr:hypothetical protein IWQ60_000694 [Tieghemiomyces parasiticus]